ncbi:MAG: LSU ribosomal protein L22p (L17e), partial [uncultured Lysobacter sp.]
GSESHPAHRAHLPAEGPSGCRSGSRSVRRACGQPAEVLGQEGCPDDPQGRRIRHRERRKQPGRRRRRTARENDHGGRRSVPEAFHGAGERPRHPHPQAHQPHHCGGGRWQV